MRKLKDIPKHMRTREWILSAIRHEEFNGVTTVHRCDCGKYCRSVMCSDCWKELLDRKKSKAIVSDCCFDTSQGCIASVCFTDKKCNSKDKNGYPLYI